MQTAGKDPISRIAQDKIIDLESEIARLRAENAELIKTLQQPDQVGYWQRRCEMAEEKLKAALARREG